jgi:hypothetical protein
MTGVRKNNSWKNQDVKFPNNVRSKGVELIKHELMDGQVVYHTVYPAPDATTKLYYFPLEDSICYDVIPSSSAGISLNQMRTLIRVCGTPAIGDSGYIGNLMDLLEELRRYVIQWVVDHEHAEIKHEIPQAMLKKYKELLLDDEKAEETIKKYNHDIIFHRIFLIIDVINKPNQPSTLYFWPGENVVSYNHINYPLELFLSKMERILLIPLSKTIITDMTYLKNTLYKKEDVHGKRIQ